MAREPKSDWIERFEHAGKVHIIKGDKLDMSGERAVKGMTKKEEDYWRAELALIGNTVKVIKVDGETQWKQGEASSRLPSEDDPETGESTGDVLLSYIITRHEPGLADKYPRVFEDYYDEALLNEDPMPNGSSSGASPKPTARIAPVSTESDTEETSKV